MEYIFQPKRFENYSYFRKTGSKLTSRWSSPTRTRKNIQNRESLNYLNNDHLQIKILESDLLDLYILGSHYITINTSILIIYVRRFS